MIDLNLDLLSQPSTWYFVVMFLFMFISAYSTGSILVGLLPTVGLTAWLSLSGYLDLWYLYVILVIVGILFSVKVLAPMVVQNMGGGSHG